MGYKWCKLCQRGIGRDAYGMHWEANEPVGMCIERMDDEELSGYEKEHPEEKEVILKVWEERYPS